MVLHSRAATDASVGATAGTFDDINTVNDPQVLNDGCNRYYGFLFSGAPVADTTNEAQSGRVRLTSTTLNLVGEIWSYGAAVGAEIATNDNGTYFPVGIVLLDIRPEMVGASSLGGARISSAFTTYNPDPTDAWSTVIAHLHSVGEQPPDNYWYYWAAGVAPPHHGGDGAGTTVSLTTRTTLGAVTMEAKFKAIVGMELGAVKDAVGTAGEEAVGFVEVTSGIGAIDPQQYPMPSLGPSLGTPVGAGMAHLSSRYGPMYVTRKENNDRAVEPFLNLSVATTAADGYHYSLAFRL